MRLNSLLPVLFFVAGFVLCIMMLHLSSDIMFCS